VLGAKAQEMQAFSSLCDAAIAKKAPDQGANRQLAAICGVKPLERASARPSRFSLHIFAICLPFRQNE
jgi:hypothetical protein